MSGITVTTASAGAAIRPCPDRGVLSRDITDARIADILRDLARRRGPDATFCPSEVARRLAEDWRPLMPRIRAVAARLPDLRAVRGGVEVEADAGGGPIRLSLRR